MRVWTSKRLDQWAYLNGVELDFSRPGKPTDNAMIEAFNARLREACLNESWFLSLEDAREKIEGWRGHYNGERPHGALGNLRPTGLCPGGHSRGEMTHETNITTGTKNGARSVTISVMAITGTPPKFMSFALLASYLRDDQLIVASTRSAQPHLNAEDLGASLVLVPPLHEQAAIVESLDKTTTDIYAAIARTHRQIELLQEYRTRLIADVVTGKLDVREAAAQLPDDMED